MASNEKPDATKPSNPNVEYNQSEEPIPVLGSDHKVSSSADSVLGLLNKKSGNPMKNGRSHQKNDVGDEDSEDDSAVGSGLLYIVEELVEEFPKLSRVQRSPELSSGGPVEEFPKLSRSQRSPELSSGGPVEEFPKLSRSQRSPELSSGGPVEEFPKLSRVQRSPELSSGEPVATNRTGSSSGDSLNALTRDQPLRVIRSSNGDAERVSDLDFAAEFESNNSVNISPAEKDSAPDVLDFKRNIVLCQNADSSEAPRLSELGEPDVNGKCEAFSHSTGSNHGQKEKIPTNGCGFDSLKSHETLQLPSSYFLENRTSQRNERNTDSSTIFPKLLTNEPADSERDWCPSLSCLVGQPDLGNLNESSVSGRNFWSDRVDDIHSSAGGSADDAMQRGKESTGRDGSPEISCSTGDSIMCAAERISCDNELSRDLTKPGAAALEYTSAHFTQDHAYALPDCEQNSATHGTGRFSPNMLCADNSAETQPSPDPEMSPSIQNMLRATGLVARHTFFSDNNGEERLRSDFFGGFVRATSGSSKKVTASTLPSLGIRKKLSKMLQREQTEIIDQLTTLRISCNCEEVYSLGPAGNLDRYSLDINNSWRDRKATVSRTPGGLKQAVGETICQAILTIDGKCYRCCRAIPRSLQGNLYRSSPALPLISLCDIHVANLRNHHCCPGCGDFCEAGDFRACSKVQGHFYHDACQDKDRSGDYRCRHCLQASHHVAVKIPNPGLVQFDLSADASSLVGLLKPRQPRLDRDNGKNKYARDFPLGFRICCAYLPARDADILEKLLKEMDLQTRVQMTLLDLLNAILQGDVAGLLHFLLLPANLQHFYTSDTARSTAALTAPVQVAIKHRRQIILSILLQAGFPFDVPDTAGLVPVEYAALLGNSVALLSLKKFYVDLPSSAFREMSLRRMLERRAFEGVALLFRFEFYNFDEFSLTEEEVFQTIWTVLSAKKPVAVTHFALCPNIVKALRQGGLGQRMAVRLISEPGNDFVLDFFRKIGIGSPSRSTISSLPAERRWLLSTGMAVPASASLPPTRSKDHLVLGDLSLGRETNPVVVINNFGDDLPALFKYITTYVVQTRHQQLALSAESGEIIPCCKCPRGQSCGPDCVCVSRSGAAVGQRRPYYTRDGRLDRTAYSGQFLFECSSSCACATHCGNSVAQRPSNGHFQIYRLEDTNGARFQWGLRTVYSLPCGYFVGRLVGSVVLLGDLMKFIRPAEEEVFVLPCPPGKDSLGGRDRYFAVVTREYGNYTRFMARRPGGNVMAVAVMSSDGFYNLPQIALFTRDLVEAGGPLILDIAQSQVTLGLPINLLDYSTAKKSFPSNAM